MIVECHPVASEDPRLPALIVEVSFICLLFLTGDQKMNAVHQQSGDQVFRRKVVETQVWSGM